MDNAMHKATKHGISVVLNFLISNEDIDDIMSAALDGGITYWCGKAEVVGEYLGEYASEQISRRGALKLFDLESDDVWELTFEKFMTGLRLWIENERPYMVIEGIKLDIGSIDAPAADTIIQYALFNDIVFG